jgi:hypothetical protein
MPTVGDGDGGVGVGGQPTSTLAAAAAAAASSLEHQRPSSGSSSVTSSSFRDLYGSTVSMNKNNIEEATFAYKKEGSGSRSGLASEQPSKEQLQQLQQQRQYSSDTDDDDDDDDDYLLRKERMLAQSSTFDLPYSEERGFRALTYKFWSFKRPYMRAVHSSSICFFTSYAVQYCIPPLLPQLQNSLQLSKQDVWSVRRCCCLSQ